MPRHKLPPPPEGFRCATCREKKREVRKVGQHCDRCWEVETRLADYVRSPRGFRFAFATLTKEIMMNVNTESHT